MSYERIQQVQEALSAGDLDRAAELLLAWHPTVDTTDLENNAVRTETRLFVSACLHTLARPAALDHRRAADLDRILYDVVERAGDHLTADQDAALRRFREIADRHEARRTLLRSGASTRPLGWSVRHTWGGVPRQRRAWQRAWRRSAGWNTTDRTGLATKWAAWAVEQGDPELLAEAYGHLVLHLPRDAAARSTAGDRHRLLTAVQEHTEEAGYWLARTRRYREAVVALETGRALSSSEPSEVAYPQVTEVTGDGALVYLAASRAGGYALVVAARQDPQFIELPRLTRQVVAGLLDRIRAGTGHRDRSGIRDLEPVAPQPGPLEEVLAELYERGLNKLSVFSARGRVVTYIPVGLIGLLPLHAAGRPSPVPDTSATHHHVGNHSAFRYAPNARALRRGQAIAGKLANAPATLLAVDVPDGYGATGRLRHVGRETAAARRHWAAPASVRNDCTWADFRAAADTHTVWHLACHGAAEPRSILNSRLLFADRQVTLRELRAMLPHGPRRLAVLSACETNLADPELPNEVVGMPSALLEAGFAGVVASSWKVDDLATAYLMTEFYRQWRGAGHEPAVALNRAQDRLRTATRADLAELLPDIPPPGGDDRFPYAHPRFWAAFAYTGA